MRADRLVALVLLLRQRGRMTADALAAELEVSTRTVLRDIDALSTAGVPVYVDRGRHGGFSLLPGFRTELTGLNHDEALALFAAGAARDGQVFGLNAALTSAMLKVADALPTSNRLGLRDAAERFLVEPDADLLSRRRPVEEVSGAVLAAVRSAVVEGRKLAFDYESASGARRSHVVDPLGLVTVRGLTYLLALKDGADRTYRVSRMVTATAMPDVADRPERVDLDELWARRSAEFLADGWLTVEVRVDPKRREELLANVRAVHPESADGDADPDGWVRMSVDYEDERHAVWALWSLDVGVDVVDPASVRDELRERAAAVAHMHAAR